MERILERLLDPAVIWIIIPILAILFWGINSVIHTIRGTPQASTEWETELQQLRERVDELERAQKRREQGTVGHA